MKSILAFLSLACVMLAGGPLRAQDPAPIPAPVSVLKMIPADALGYVVVSDVKAATDQVDAYIKEIGLADDVASEMPQGCLAALLKECGMEDGLNPAGGAALVMLDPQPLGVNLLSMLIPSAAGGTASAPAPAKLPYAILLPAAAIKPLLSGCDFQEGKPYAKVTLMEEEFFVAASNGYVVLSPNANAVDAILNATDKADAELSAEQLKQITSASAALQMNCKVVGPMAQRMMNAMNLAVLAGKATGALPNELAEFVRLRPSLTHVVKGLNEMERLIVTVQPVKTGLLARGTVSYLPGTPGAKEVAAAAAATPQSLLDSVPDLRYTMAAGAVLNRSDTPGAMVAQLDALLQAVKEIKPRQRAQIVAWFTKAQQEIDAIQFVMNQNEDSADGTVNMALVLKCQDPARLQGILAEGVTLANDVGRDVAAACCDDPNDLAPADANEPMVKYVKDAGKIGDVSVGAIEADLQIPDSETVLGVLLGDTRLRAIVAPAGPKSLVISMGGGTAAMEKNLAAARKLDGKILASDEAKGALEQLGPNLQAVFVMNIANYFELVSNTMGRMVPGGMGEMPAMKCKAPIAAGVGVRDSTRTISLYVPTEMVKEVCDTFHRLSTPAHAPAPPPKAEDF